MTLGSSIALMILILPLHFEQFVTSMLKTLFRSRAQDILFAGADFSATAISFPIPTWSLKYYRSTFGIQ